VLTEERYAVILKVLDDKKAVAVTDLTKLLNASESTIRRDLTALHNKGKLYKVYGGATSLHTNYSTLEEDTATKKTLHAEEKNEIARYAASLIEPDDFVYLDAGTTTEYMIDWIAEMKATFVTNGIVHASRLADRGFSVFILSGRVKSSTGAVIGTESLDSLERYNFTKGFFGTNGISIKAGYSTPDTVEGSVKATAMAHCRQAFVLADESKFNKVAPISFAAISRATILTTKLADKKYRDYTTILEVKQL